MASERERMDWLLTNAEYRELQDELATLRAELAAVREQYAMSLEEHGELMRQREETSSQLWDCMSERDGWKHRAERMERAAVNVIECHSALTDFLAAVRALDAEAQP
jgi:uncharacterized coiled-coil DUF342 family protein